MSAYNRKVLMQMDSGSSTIDMDESGYASFRALHNSTVEAPFLCEETENCLSASNARATATTCGLRKAITTAITGTTTGNTTFNSMQFQTPSNNNEFSFNSNTNNINTTLWRNNKPLSLSCGLQLDIEDDEMCCKSPLPLSMTLPPGANKRRHKSQHMAHHSSPKKSKKILFPQPIIDPLCRTRYYNGIEKLDIIGMLLHKVPALECIFSKLSSTTLDTMTKVSELWAQAVYRSERARERLENHRFKMSLSKENQQHSVKGQRKLSRSTNNCNLVPLQPSNAIHKPNIRHDFKFHRNAPIDINCLLVEQSQRIKCPRCGKSSKVFYSPSSNKQQTLQHSRYPKTTTSLSQTLPHSYAMSQERNAPPLMRFYSLDEVKSCSPDENDNENESQPSFTFGECTSMLCKFRFCVHCCSAPHPGEKCLVTEMGTPSKAMMPGEKWTPPKQTQKYDSKLSRKKSLKRLNF